MAVALEHLAALAQKTARALSGASLEDLAKNYESGGFETDLTLLRALAEGKSNQDRASIHAAARAMYLPWLQTAAELFQQLVGKTPMGGWGQQPAIEANVGECLLFADALRFDLAQELRALCEERSWKVALGRRWAGIPTVTATAKPAVSPVARLLQGGMTLPDDFTPTIKSSGLELNTARFRKLLEEAGYQYLAAGETGDCSGRAWSECGHIDRRGHDMQLALAGQLAEELDGIVERIAELLDGGWRVIRIVTDHGWLLMPGGLPKTELPGYLLESRWARCAAIRGQSKVSVPKAGWFWNPSAEVAISPDITAFASGVEYAHGGLSLQECLIPLLTIEPAKEASPTAARIKTVEWQRLRCRVTLETPMEGLTVDIRTKANAQDTSLAAQPKVTDAKGQASLVIPDDEQAGAAAVVVVVDAGGNVLTKQATTIGES